MSDALVLYTRKDCCLCDEMKAVVRRVAARHALELSEVDVDASPALRAQFGEEVPVLFIGGRKAFKYRVTAGELELRLRSRGVARRLSDGWKKWR